MYEIFEICCPLMACLLGLFMAIFPKTSTKKEKRDDPEAVAKNRKGGIAIAICGAVCTVLLILT